MAAVTICSDFGAQENKVTHCFQPQYLRFSSIKWGPKLYLPQGTVKGAAESEMVGWHHWLPGHESEQTPGDSEGQGSLVGLSPWGCKEWDMTERLNNRRLLGGTDYYAYKVLRIVPETKNLIACNCYCYQECYNCWNIITIIIITILSSQLSSVIRFKPAYKILGWPKDFISGFCIVSYGKTPADFCGQPNTCFTASPVLYKTIRWASLLNARNVFFYSHRREGIRQFFGVCGNACPTQRF